MGLEKETDRSDSYYIAGWHYQKNVIISSSFCAKVQQSPENTI